MVTEKTIPWSGGEVSGRLGGSGRVGILLAHGAGTNQDHPLIVLLRDGLAAAGHMVLTFNYPYTERGSKRPDRMETLLECHRGAAEWLRPKVDDLFLAGRSMGGRVATHLAADGYPAAGVILYAYPLHPAGRPEKLRVAHLSEAKVPMLFFQGTRDALSRMDLFDQHIRVLPGATVEILEGAGHGTKGGGWSPETLAERLVTASSAWVATVRSGTTGRRQP